MAAQRLDQATGPFSKSRRKQTVSARGPAIFEGFRVRLLETEGRACRASLAALRPIGSAMQTDFHGEALCDLPLENEQIMIDFAQYEWVQLEARWK